MKNVKTILISIIACLSLSSCYTAAYAQYDDGYCITSEVTYSTIISYGVPFYVDNVISYYLYNGIYYYPYYWGGHRYFYPFDRPMPRGYHFTPGYNHHPRPMLGDNHRGGYRGGMPSSSRITGRSGSSMGPRSNGSFSPRSNGGSSMGPRSNGGSSMGPRSNGGGSHMGGSHSGGGHR